MTVVAGTPPLVGASFRGVEKVAAPSPFQVKMPSSADAAKFAAQPSSAEWALKQFEESYTQLLDAIRLDKFNPAKIEDYIRQHEHFTKMPMDEVRKEQIREMAKATDPNILKLVALELRIGVPKKAERKALAAMGWLILNRENGDAMQAFLDDPEKDPNLKAHVKTIMMMAKLEEALHKYESVKSRVLDWVTLRAAWRTISGWGGGQQSNQQDQPKKSKKDEKKEKGSAIAPASVGLSTFRFSLPLPPSQPR